MTSPEHMQESPDQPSPPAPGSGFVGMLWSALKEIVLVLVMAMVLSFVVKTWLLQAFSIPSGSMQDTLQISDRVVVSKLTPSPIDLERGDIVVFEDPSGWLGAAPVDPREGLWKSLHDTLVFVGLKPSEAEDHLIKRVVGLPGDRVVCCDAEQRLTINDAPVQERYLFPGDVPSTVAFDITVPAGRIWVMGDHRSDSGDSRFHDPGGTGAEGSVPIERVTGRAIAVVWPLNRLDWLSGVPETFSGVPSALARP